MEIMKRLEGPGNLFTIGAALAVLAVAVFLAVRYWWVMLLAGALLMLTAALGWLALNAGRVTRKDFEKLMRKLRLAFTS